MKGSQLLNAENLTSVTLNACGLEEPRGSVTLVLWMHVPRHEEEVKPEGCKSEQN